MGVFKVERLWNEACNPKEYSPLTLAFIGDAVFEVMVREKLVCEGNRSVKKLHAGSGEMVRCDAQAQAVEAILPLLTEEEQDILRRGRNAHPMHTPKNADAGVYHIATGFECLMGYLYLKGEIERLRELCTVIFEPKKGTEG